MPGLGISLRVYGGTGLRTITHLHSLMGRYIDAQWSAPQACHYRYYHPYKGQALLPKQSDAQLPHAKHAPIRLTKASRVGRLGLASASTGSLAVQDVIMQHSRSGRSPACVALGRVGYHRQAKLTGCMADGWDKHLISNWNPRVQQSSRCRPSRGGATEEWARPALRSLALLHLTLLVRTVSISAYQEIPWNSLLFSFLLFPLLFLQSF